MIKTLQIEVRFFIQIGNEGTMTITAERSLANKEIAEWAESWIRYWVSYPWKLDPSLFCVLHLIF